MLPTVGRSEEVNIHTKHTLLFRFLVLGIASTHSNETKTSFGTRSNGWCSSVSVGLDLGSHIMAEVICLDTTSERRGAWGRSSCDRCSCSMVCLP